MARELSKGQIWSELEAEYRRAHPQGESPEAASDTPPVVIEAAAPSAPADGDTSSAQSQRPPEPSTLNAVDAPVAGEAAEVAEQRAEDDALIARLTALPPIAYYRERQAAAEKLGIPVRVLDDMVKSARREAAADDALFADVAPCKESVDPAELHSDVSSTIRRFVKLSREQADACALWVVSTYLTDVADTSPLLVITSAERACGKTQLKAVLGRLVHRPLHAANASAPAPFRVIESDRPTLLIDEADTFLRDRPELHGLINAGHSRGEFVLRTEASGDEFRVRKFAVFGPKAIVGIALHRHLPDATWSRAIVVSLHRKLQDERVDRLRDVDPQEFERLRSRVARFALDCAQRVRLARPKLPADLDDRAADNWRPLIAIAECAGPEWVERATAAALKLSGAGESQASIGSQLLEDVRGIFDRWRSDKISTADLIEELCRDEERPWATYNRGKQVTPRQMARLLSAYGVRSKTVRLGPSKTPKGYERSQFDDAFARYLPPQEQQRPSRDAPPNRVPEVIDPADPGDWPDEVDPLDL
jgi:hypothetical protein